MAPANRILETLPAGLLVLEASGRILSANPRAAAILQVPQERLIGKRVDEVFETLAVLRRALQSPDEEARRQVQLERVDGDPITIGYSVAEVGGSETHILVMFQDITAWTQLQDERDRLLQLAAVGEVLPSLLHELRNPLTSIMVSVELMLEELPGGGVRDNLHAVLSELRRMNLSFEGIGAVGRSLPAERYMAVDYAIKQACALLKSRASTTGIALESDVPDMPLLPLDIGVVRAIVFNLVTNAIQACSPGGTVRLAARLAEPGPTFELRVEDDGRGMPPEVLEQCRTLFFTTKTSGSGIGLALCEQAAGSAGGRIEVSSLPGKGTTVSLKIPIRKPRAP